MKKNVLYTITKLMKTHALIKHIYCQRLGRVDIDQHTS